LGVAAWFATKLPLETGDYDIIGSWQGASLPVYSATSSGWLSPRGRLLSAVGLGVLTHVIDPDLVDEAVGDGLAWEMRLRSLPSRLGMYFVLGLCLFSSEPYAEVLRELTAGLRTVLKAAGWAVPATTALTGVRRRVGEKPLESLFRRLRGPLSPGRAPWSHICGLLAVAWDGTTADVAASAENIAAFGRPAAGSSPQVRMVTLAACGTRALIDAAFGPLRGKGTGERELARALMGSLHAGMLLLADRGFCSYQLWIQAAQTGAALLWRVRASMHLPVVAALPDGSWLTHINDPAAVTARARRNGMRRRRGGRLPPQAGPLPGITVRVIEFTITVTTQDGSIRTGQYRLITTLLDWQAYPAAALAAGYGWRWAIETGYRDLKVCLRGPGRVLRSQTPELARQELWAYLVIYQAIRLLIARTAAGAGLDPDQISFTATVRAARRTITTARSSMNDALAETEAEILASLIPLRQGRVCPRAVKQPVSPYPSRNTRDDPITQHATYAITLTTPATSTRTTTHQPTHPANQPPRPP
jgi:hypothetical protein